MSEQVLCSGSVAVVRPGWVSTCSHCRKRFGYRAVGVQVRYWPTPWLYCGECSSIVCRDQDSKYVEREHFRDLSARGLDLGFYHNTYAPEFLERAMDELAELLPPCPCGGRFEVWAVPRCPWCRHPIERSWSRSRDIMQRFHDVVVQIVGATWYYGGGCPAERLRRLSWFEGGHGPGPLARGDNR